MFLIGRRVIFRGAIYEVMEIGERYGEPWVRITALVNYTRDYGAETRWTAARLCKAQCDA